MTKRTVRRLLVAAAVLLLAAVCFFGASWALIGWTDAGSDRYAGGVILRDDAGTILRVSLGPGDTDCRPYYRVHADDWIAKAVVASEDGTFWTHAGVRPLSILRATCQNVFYRRRISGASTLTMQVVRLIRPHPRSLWWKWKEAVMALKMERAKSKEWILSQYLNRAPFGSNLVGIEAAAQGWFGKGAKELGLGEAAMLAGLVQAPSRFRPDRHYDKALKRRDYVLGRMLKRGVITKDQLAGAKSVNPVVCRASRPFACPHFCDWALLSLGPEPHGDHKTALNADAQRICENAVAAAAEAGGYSAASVVMRVADGAVVAMACSGDYFDPEGGQVNTAVTPRPAGSTLKPFLTAVAIEKGVVTPDVRLADVPIAFKGYRPTNFDAKHRGLVTVREALIQSLNVPFVQLLRRIGIDAFGDNLRELGFGHLGAPDESFGLGMAIGNVEVSLLELVSAYAVLARQGMRTDGVRVFSPATCYLISDILSGDERTSAALGHVADVRVSRFAWKTGTSSAYRDAWTVAWNPEYVVGVWCGHKSGGFGDRTLVGAKAAAPVAWKIARQFYPQQNGPWFVRPDDVVPRKVCSLTGLPASPDCPDVVDGVAIRGRSSPALCMAHRRAADGTVVTRMDASLAAFSGVVEKAERLAISSPEDGATFAVVPGAMNQKIVCRTVGNPSGAELWWFVDGRFAGKSVGSEVFSLDLVEGDHVIMCTTQEGVSAHVTIHVKVLGGRADVCGVSRNIRR